MKRFLLYIFCFFSITTLAQEKILVEGATPNLYFTHTVAVKETLYSLSRSFNQTPAAIATLNSIANDAQLSVGAKIKIPLSKNNFTQDGQKAADETLVPLYHIVQAKQTLYGISRLYNNVNIDFVREWNNIVKDVIKLNQYLVIGHLKIKSNNLPSNAAAASIPASTDKQSDFASIKKTEIALAAKTIAKKDSIKIIEDKKTDVAPIINGESNSAPAKVIEEKKQDADISQPVLMTPQKSQNELIPVNNIHIGDKGYFSSLYNKGKNEISGDAAIIKSSSGWADGKFYVLMNNADKGFIVKVTANGRTIYAKVLGPLPDIKEDNGLLMRISNAGVAALGINDNKFFVTVNY